MSGSVPDVLRVARAELGTRGADGGSPGDGQKYALALGYPVTGWCAIFVSWCLRQAKVPQAYSATRVTLFARHYAAERRFLRTPRAGDLACFGWGLTGALDHIAIVEKVLPDGRLQTIEGNTHPGDGRHGVYRMVRSPRHVPGYCRPAYAATVLGTREHIVTAGQTLTRIASIHGTTVAAVRALNPSLDDPGVVHVGQRIRVR